MGASKVESSRHLGRGARRAIGAAAITSIYLICFLGLHRLTAGAQTLPQLGAWNLTAGLTLWLLDFSLGYLPVAAFGYFMAMLWSGAGSAPAWEMAPPALAAAGIFALGLLAIRKLAACRRLELLHRRSLFSLLVCAPAIGLAASAAIAGILNLQGLLAWNDVSAAILNGFLGTTAGIVLAAPFFLWTAPGIIQSALRKSGVALSTMQPAAEAVDRAVAASIVLAALGTLPYLAFAQTTADRFSLFCLAGAPAALLAFGFGLTGASSALLAFGIVAGASAQGAATAHDVEIAAIASSVIAMLIGSLAAEARRREQTAKRQAALLGSVSFGTDQLLSAADREKSIQDVLGHLAAAADAARIYVVENRETPKGAAHPVLYEHWDEAAVVDQHHLQLLNVVRSKQIQDHAASLAKGEPLRYQTDELPEEECAIMGALNLRSAVILPVFTAGRWWGCLGVDQTASAGAWTDAELEAFKAAAHALGTLLGHANVEHQFRQFTGNIPAVFWIASPDGVQRTYVSPAYEQIWGRPCESIQQDPESWLAAIYYEDRERIRAAIAKQIWGEFDEEYRIARLDWSVRWIRDTAFPVRDASGQVTRIVGIAQDITRQKEAEQRLQATTLLLSTLIDNLPVGILVEDDARRVRHVNRAFCRMFDIAAPQESLVGVDSRLAYAQQHLDGKRIDEIIQGREARRGEEIASEDHRVFNRDYIPLLVDGNNEYHLWQYDDVTERRRYEERIRSSLKEKEVLLKEIHHRVKNNLQVISSLLNLQATQIRDNHTAEIFKDSQSRVKAMALVHERLYQSPDLARIDFAGYVEDVTRHLVKSYAPNHKAIRLKLEVDPVSLNIDTAIPCALIINELVSNSLKYAFPNGRDGEIRIRLNAAGGELNLVISDNGVGLPAGISCEETDSLGLQLVYNLASQLGGLVKHRNNGGTEFQIRFRPVVHETLLKRA